ncbi:Oidioi.mRNA.OKI2018_I69.chr2.g7098.t2.cds [Oikopleura dioica]|uniref:Oidioi.mRNA.OKI2018_I69.chr2.g7098.t2.cds n=1 Tax=Oikopleura dioica TaxID=34765 RepID=A0ABN7T8U2_OIKDI|nr:Oidioi.mRNA.OKI2018_I69.chr2.g7098.t2.cds [Oikopleura dioica]
MITFSFRITKWSSRTLSLVGLATVGYLGVSAVVGRGSNLVEDDEATFAKRSSAFQVDPLDMPYEIKFEPSYLIENSNKMEKMFFHQQKEDKEYIKYQYPEDRFAPIEELGVVYLNGIKFYHQGESMLPESDEEKALKLTRSSEDRGEFCMDWKLAKEHRAAQKKIRDAERKAKNDACLQDPNSEAPQTEAQKQESTTPAPRSRTAGGGGGNGGSRQSTEAADTASAEDEDSEDADDDFTAALETTPNTPAYSPAAAEIQAQKKVRIGCCNGMPYTNNKRCCCRRAAFDKDTKFCCAINGCENFRIFERTENNYSACQSLQGLVVQEYGYTGQWAHLGEPDFTKTQRPEPSEIRHPYRARYPYGKPEDQTSDAAPPSRPTRPTRPVRG